MGTTIQDGSMSEGSDVSHGMLEPLYFNFLLPIFYDLIFLYYFLNDLEVCDHGHMTHHIIFIL